MSMLETLLDPARRAKGAEYQAKLRETMGSRVTKNPAQAKYLFGVARERMALDQLALVTSETGISAANLDALYLQLAEGLKLQGKFEAAVEVAPAGEHKELYKEQAAAVAKIGEKRCKHWLTRKTDQEGVREATQLTSEKIFTGTETITFTRCLQCGVLSAYA